MKILSIENLKETIRKAQPILECFPEAIKILDQANNEIFVNQTYLEWEKRGLEKLICVETKIVMAEAVGKIFIYYDVSEIRRLRTELDRVKQKLKNTRQRIDFSDFSGESIAVRRVIAQAKVAAPTPATIMLRGESGTGKEILAHAIHNESMRRNQAFIKINCSTIPEELLESELFGYTEGAFTGALRGGKKGLFHEASGGTLFLDEIGDVSGKMQVKLLRVLQEKEIRPVGSAKSERVDVRIICATHKNLEEMVRNGEFREDLYYRLNVFPIYIPPLRERREDIAAIAFRVLKRCNEFYGRSVQDIDADAIELLAKCDWPGNVRELENILSRIMINLSTDKLTIDKQDVEAMLEYREKPVITGTRKRREDFNLLETVKDAERECITEALSVCENDKNRAAVLLGIPVRTLYYKCKKLGI